MQIPGEEKNSRQNEENCKVVPGVLGGKQKHTWAGVSKGGDEKMRGGQPEKNMLVQFITVTCYLLFIPNSTLTGCVVQLLAKSGNSVWEQIQGVLDSLCDMDMTSSWDSQQSGNFFLQELFIHFLFIFINFLIWSIADLQRWINFRCTAKRFLF